MHFLSFRFRAGPLCLVLLFVPAACDGPRTVTKQETVEVAPAHFVTLTRTDEVGTRRDGMTKMNIPWDGRELRWSGYAVPFALRSSCGRLYMITFDRHTDFDKIRLRYYRQNNAADGFDEIGHGEFPKSVASQNMWLGDPDAFSRGTNGEKIYELDLALRLDPEDRYFMHTLTATTWCQLHTGREYYELKGMVFEEKQKIVREFAAAHRPIKLTKIVQRSTTGPSTQATAGGPTAH